MKNTKKFVSTSLFVLLILTLVSFCFVGFTFARYTSTGTGAASVTVAKWDVSGVINGTDVSGTTTVDFGKLSPSAAEKADGVTRTNSTKAIKILTITNNSDVDAKITIAAGDITFTTVSPAVGTFNEENAKKVFSIKLYKEEACTNEITADGFTLAAKTDAATATQDVWAVVTWTSDVDGITDADANDTMIGQNVTSISYGFTYTAVQTSKIPA